MFFRLQGSIAEASAESVAEARNSRRRRKLDRIEIPEDHLFITDDLLGKGGFGEVYLADYNGHNAAVKVCGVGSMTWTILSSTQPLWVVMPHGLKSSASKGYLASPQTGVENGFKCLAVMMGYLGIHPRLGNGPSSVVKCRHRLE